MLTIGSTVIWDFGAIIVMYKYSTIGGQKKKSWHQQEEKKIFFCRPLTPLEICFFWKRSRYMFPAVSPLSDFINVLQ